MKNVNPDFIVLLDLMTSISDTEKRALVKTAQRGTPFPEGFEAGVLALIDTEITATEHERATLDEHIATATSERDAARAEAAPRITKLTNEYTQLCQSEFDKLQTELGGLAKTHDERVEQLVVTENDDAAVAAIKTKLMKKG